MVLSLRKGAFDRPPIPASMPLPAFPASLAGEAALRLKRNPGLAVEPEARATSLEPPPVALPEPPPVATRESGPAAASDRPGPSTPPQPRPESMPLVAAAARPQDPGPSPVSPAKGFPVAPAATVNPPRSIDGPSHLMMPPAGSPPTREIGASPVDLPNFGAPAGTIGSGPKVGVAGLGPLGSDAISPRAADAPKPTIERPGEPAPRPSIRPEPQLPPGGSATVKPSAGAGHELSFGAGSGPFPGNEASTITVRNFRSDDLKKLALASPSPTRGGGAPSDSGQGGPASPDRGFDAAASSQAQGAGAVDLSRTNELLQQLIDAVRRQGGPSMPAGGPAVYPGR